MLSGRILSEVDVEKIHQASLRILEKIGLKLEHEKVRELLRANGACPGKDNETVCFPQEMVGEYLSLAPQKVKLCGRGGREWIVGPQEPPVFWTAAAMNLVDSGGRREFDRRGLASLARLVDVLPNLDGVVGVSVKDVPPMFRDLAGFRTMIENTGKHMRVLSFTPSGVKAILEMAQVVLGSEKLAEKPIFSMGFTAHGPLRWTNLALDIYSTSAGYGIPVMVNGEPMAGATSPVTMAGALTVANAEVLGGIIINQVLEPGRPCIHNLGFSHVMDMRTGIAVTGGPETCLMAAAGAQLACFYNLPSASWMSTESMLADSQSAVEKTMAAITHAASGVGIIWGAGTLESELSISFAQLVIDDEIIGQVKRLLRGIEVNEGTIAEELIASVGPCGNFLATEHTMLHFRNEIHESRLFCRTNRENWEKQGSIPLTQKADMSARELIARAVPPALHDEEIMELEKIEKKFMQKN
jgi:trimethylamine--corrinoid protein Co-methyltransferase